MEMNKNNTTRTEMMLSDQSWLKLLGRTEAHGDGEQKLEAETAKVKDEGVVEDKDELAGINKMFQVWNIADYISLNLNKLHFKLKEDENEGVVEECPSRRKEGRLVLNTFGYGYFYYENLGSQYFN